MITDSSPVVEVTLDRERLFQWSGAAAYRLGCVFPLPRAHYSQLVAFLWATQIPDSTEEFSSPEKFAVIVDVARIDELIEQVVKKVGPDCVVKNIT